MISLFNQLKQPLSQKVKTNELLAAQAYSNVLQERYGITSCCPPPDKVKAHEYNELREMLEWFFPENPAEKGCRLDIECAETLIEKINTL